MTETQQQHNQDIGHRANNALIEMEEVLATFGEGNGRNLLAGMIHSCLKSPTAPGLDFHSEVELAASFTKVTLETDLSRVNDNLKILVEYFDELRDAVLDEQDAENIALMVTGHLLGREKFIDLDFAIRSIRTNSLLIDDDFDLSSEGIGDSGIDLEGLGSDSGIILEDEVDPGYTMVMDGDFIAPIEPDPDF